MKRHEAIAPLSRDHHHSLILAQLLKKGAPKYKGLPDKPEGIRAYALKEFDEKIKAHFTLEENILLKLKGIYQGLDDLIAEIFTEHLQLRLHFENLKEADDIESSLDMLGQLLENHIRKEERILFPLMQEHCTDEMLEEIHQLTH